MEQTVISVQDVSKKFRLFNSPQERLLEALHPFNKKYHKEFWALKNINFEIKKGTTVGIVGRNGAGKSTLLQIICSILKPTTGNIAVNGRISTLLALGAGFNPEFTGRQNVLMNGALMGFSSEEMKKRLPEIEAFADIGEFIDQPLKIYSSGMSLRLAFAAAINVDPDILVVDEALAVGDAKFQHKCYGKFLEFQEAGKTIIFVTHSTEAIIRYCDIAILLERGEIVEIGKPKNIINYYIDLLFTGKISNYQFSPILVDDIKGFNIIHYKTKYYALSQSLGPLDLAFLQESDLKHYIANRQCVIGTSLEEVTQLVHDVMPCDYASNQSLTMPCSPSQKTELDEFLECIPNVNNCINRNSYNKNEYRFGDQRAEIIDYLIVSERGFDHATISSGNTIDIYLKTVFYEPVEFPIFGFSIKTIDGIAVYASNTRFLKTSITPVKKSDVIICMFSIRLSLHPGDFFVDLGVVEDVSNQDKPIDVRYGIVHLIIQPKDYWFDGIVDFEAKFNEVLRKKC